MFNKDIIQSITYPRDVLGGYSVSQEVQLAPTESKKIVVPKDYRTIEAGIEHAEEGDTVFVCNGTYTESIVMRDKIVLVGESVSRTIIRGKGHGVVVRGADKTIISQNTLKAKQHIYHNLVWR